MKIELEKDILKSLGLYDTTISFGLDDDIQIAIERKIDNYLKKIDEEQKKKEQIDFVKQEHEKFKKKSEFVNTFNDNYVYGKVKNKLIRDGFIYGCPTCRPLDVSHEYMKPTKKKQS